LPPAQSFLRLIPGRAVITAIHRTAGATGTVIRMFNPSDKTIEEKLECFQPIASAELIDLQGQKIDTLSIAGGHLKISLAPRKILTLRIA
jgi:mannosylglycerate hydrolase